jgi:Multidrug resistance efflux pump
MLLYEKQPDILQGQVEATQIKISGKLLGRIEKFYVKEGENVKKGDTLVLINSPEVDAQLQTASAMKDVASYQNKKIDSGTREQIIKALKEVWMAAKANAELAKTTNIRVQNLYSDSVATPQRADEASAMEKAAKAQEQAAYYNYQMALKGAQIEDKESAKAMVYAAEGGVGAITALLADANLSAPDNGEISSIYPEEGELVMPGTPIMNLIKLDDCYVVLNIRENLLPYFKMGSTFIGSIPALDKEKMKFEVYYISPLGSFATWRSTKQTGSYDVVTFEIKARPEKRTSNGLRPGMSVLVKLDKDALL